MNVCPIPASIMLHVSTCLTCINATVQKHITEPTAKVKLMNVLLHHVLMVVSVKIELATIFATVALMALLVIDVKLVSITQVYLYHTYLLQTVINLSVFY